MKTTDNQNELFIVVDENDNVVDYRTRGECHSDKSLIHRSVQIVLFDGEGKVLVQKRSLSKDLYPGYFTVSASGHVDKGETYEQTANRELKEEIGLEGRLKMRGKFLVKTDNETEFTALFTGEAKGEVLLNTEEVAEIMYLTKDELKIIEDKLTPMAKLSFEELGIL